MTLVRILQIELMCPDMNLQGTKLSGFNITSSRCCILHGHVKNATLAAMSCSSSPRRLYVSSYSIQSRKISANYFPASC